MTFRRSVFAASAGALLLAALGGLAGCDNVGRVFDRDVTPDTPTEPTVSIIQVPPARGDIRDGRPLVRETYPKGGGWPSTTPIVVEFSESINQATVLPTTPAGADGRVVLRVSGQSLVIPAQYDFLAGGRVLVLRPISPLNNAAQSEFDVVMLPGVRDTDGIRFRNTEDSVLATFSIDPDAPADGEILALFPRDNARDVARDSDLIAVFTRPPQLAFDPNPPNPPLLNGAFVVRTEAGTPVAGTYSAPLGLGVVDAPDPRILQFRPPDAGGYAASTLHEVVVTSGFTFADGGVLEFNGRTPFARFTAAGVPTPTAVTVQNATAGFADKVNRSNLETLQMQVDVPADTAAGDRVLVRVYGSDKQTADDTRDLAFVERTAEVAAAGAGSIAVDFTGQLGLLGRERFDDGPLSYTAQLVRGAQHSGVVLGSTAGAQDAVIPELRTIGPTTAANGNDLFFELEHLVVFGTASERIGSASLMSGLNSDTAELFASSADGRFLLAPLSMGRMTGPTTFSLTARDAAGNEVAAPINGTLVQRGTLTGLASSGTLVIEAYDEATLRPLANVEVLVDPTVPVVPAIARVLATTDAAGRATITPPPSLTTNTITLLLDGYDLVTLYDSPVGFASLPMRPSGQAASTAAVQGVATFPAGAAPARMAFGSNLFDDPTALSTLTSASAPNTIPRTVIRPNRLQVHSAFAGTIEPTQDPPFSSQSFVLGGADFATPTPPGAPLAVGEDGALQQALRAPQSLTALPPIAGVNFQASQGLNPNALIGQPIVRMQVSLDGLPGQALFGLGTAAAGPTNVTVRGSWSATLLTTLAPFAPTLWVTSQAQDTAGVVSRARGRVGTSAFHALPQIVHEISGSTTLPAPPLIQLFDALDTANVLDVSGGTITGLLGIYEIDIRAASGRGWRLFCEDVDVISASPRDYQLPGHTAPTLPNGEWQVMTYARLFEAGAGGAGNFVLGERLRREVTMTRWVSTYTITP